MPSPSMDLQERLQRMTEVDHAIELKAHGRLKKDEEGKGEKPTFKNGKDDNVILSQSPKKARATAPTTSRRVLAKQNLR